MQENPLHERAAGSHDYPPGCERVPSVFKAIEVAAGAFATSQSLATPVRPQCDSDHMYRCAKDQQTKEANAIALLDSMH